jgi:hypothetical protein
MVKVRTGASCTTTTYKTAASLSEALRRAEQRQTNTAKHFWHTLGVLWALIERTGRGITQDYDYGLEYRSRL